MQRKRTRYQWLPAFIAGMALIGGQLVNEAAAPARINAGPKQEPELPKPRSTPEPTPPDSDQTVETSKPRFSPASQDRRYSRPSNHRGKGRNKYKKPKKHKHKDDEGDD